MDDSSSIQVFGALESRLTALQPQDPAKVRRDWWLYVGVLLGFLITVAAKHLPATFWVSLSGIALEFSCFGVLAVRQAQLIVPDFIDSKRKFAAELDQDFRDLEEIRDWLRQVPIQTRRKLLIFAEERVRNFEKRFPLFFGPVEKLGALPLLAALFLQWRAITSVTIWDAVFGFGLLGLYTMAFWLAGLRFRLDRYAQILRSIEEDQVRLSDVR